VVDRESRGGGGISTVSLPQGITLFEPRAGVTRLDFIPYIVTAEKHPDKVAPGELWFRRPIKVHRNIGIDNKTYICPRSEHKKGCPIDEEVHELGKNRTENLETIRTIGTKDRDLFNLIDLDHEDKGIQLFDISYHLFGKRLREDLKFGKEEYRDFAELQGGFTLLVRWSERSFGDRKFYEAARIDFEPREDYNEGILKRVAPLDDILIIPTYEELQEAFLEVAAGDIAPAAGAEPRGAPAGSSSDISQFRGGGKAPEDTAREEEVLPDTGTRRERTKTPPDTGGEEKCPHGGKFGVTSDELKACDKCKLWDDCMDERDKREKK
jgi:hypothetical protein